VRPPALARTLLSLLARAEDRAFLLADLEEELVERARRDGPGAARRWYRWQAVTSAPHLLARRLRRSRRRGAAREAFVPALVHDVRFAVRAFLRAPGFTALALLTLAVAIAANTALFSVVNGVLLKPVPGIHDTEGLVEVSRRVQGDALAGMSYPAVRIMAGSSALEGAAAMDWEPVSIGGSDRPEVRVALGVTSSYFDVLGIGASRGRMFASEEATFPSVRPVAVISEHLRATRFPDERIPGATLVVNGMPLTVIGAGPEGFRGHAVAPVDVFIPLGLPVPAFESEAGLAEIGYENLQVIARLAPGVSKDRAAEELTALVDAAVVERDGARPGSYEVQVDPWGWVPATARTPVTLFLSGMLLLAGLVLAMACINVAGMMLSRAVERGGEIAVRVALGAGRGRITRQLLSEAALLGVAAGVLGLLLAGWLTRLLVAFQPPLPPGYELALDFGLDWRVLVYSFAVAVGFSVIFGMAPAVHAARTDVMATIKGGMGGSGRTRTLGRRALVSGQMALSLVLLVVAGLFLRSLASMGSADTGWSAAGVWATDLDLELTGAERAEGAAFQAELLRRLASMPGVASAALAHKLPLGSVSSFGDVTTDGLDPPEGGFGFPASFLRVTPGYFGTLDLAILQGRAFTEADGEGTPDVAIVNGTMARRFWPDTDPVGKTFRIDGIEDPLTVVGVAEDASYLRMVEEPRNFYYVPAAQWYNAHMALFVKPSAGREEDVRTGVADLVHALQPDLPVQPLVPLESSLAVSFLPQRIAAWVSGVLGALGLLLGAVGVYGVTSFAVSRRVREIGIRKALGASGPDVVRLVLREGMVAPLVGVALGLCGAFAVARVLGSFLAGVGTADPVAVGTALVTLLLVASVATLVPAWRAARRQPLSSLRTE
jgi:predicted permease